MKIAVGTHKVVLLHQDRQRLLKIITIVEFKVIWTYVSTKNEKVKE